jgi:hypothetical protein
VLTHVAVRVQQIDLVKFTITEEFNMRRYLNRTSVYYNLISTTSDGENIYYALRDKTNRWIMKMKMIGNVVQSDFKYTDLNVEVIRIVTYDKSSFVSATVDTSNLQWGYFLTTDTTYRIQLSPFEFNRFVSYYFVLIYCRIITLPPEFNAQGLLLADSSTHTLYCVGYNGIMVPIDVSMSIKVISIYFIVFLVGILVACPILCLFALAVNFQKLRNKMMASRSIENDMRRLLTEMVEYRRGGEHKEWIIDMSELKITNRVAEGASGVVFKVSQLKWI